jgi:hypothetical protein
MSAGGPLATRYSAAVAWVARTVPDAGAVVETWSTPDSAEQRVHIVPLRVVSSGGPIVEMTLTCAVLATGPTAFVAESLARLACTIDRPEGVEVLPDLPPIDWSFGIAPKPALGLRISATELRQSAAAPVVREELHLGIAVEMSPYDARNHPPPKLEVHA